jgi:hypothetical protein
LCDRIFPPLLLPLEITQGCFEVLDRILEPTETAIAVVTKKATHFASSVVMVNG